MLQINDLPMTDAAYDAVWALNEAAGANAHIRGAIQRARDDARRPHGEVVRLIATLDGTPVGHAGAFPLVSYAGPGRRYCQLAVHPDHQGRGVGRALLQALLARLPDARELLGQLRAGDARARRVLDHLGGVVGSEDLEQRLLLADVDVARLEALAGRLAALGLRVVPLARLKAEVPDWVARLHRLHVGLDEDVPSPVDHEPPDLDAWAAAELGVPDARHDALFLALDGDAWVGVCELRQPGRPDALIHDLTGVVRPWRRRGVAAGLKATAALWARQAGLTHLTTWTHVENAAMRATNARIGFQEVARWLLWISERGGGATG